ncbi:MAG: hypothetical protein MKZ70_04965, partial [Opitutales bacterium]|nr:hypothetical protein [Opitutales bacterium]
GTNNYDTGTLKFIAYVPEILFVRDKSRAKLGVGKSLHADEVCNIFALPHRKSDIYGKRVIRGVADDNVSRI